MSGGSAEIFVLPSGQCAGSQRRLIRSWIEGSIRSFLILLYLLLVLLNL